MTPEPRVNLPLQALDPELAKFDHGFFAGLDQTRNAQVAAAKIPSHAPPKKLPRRFLPYEIRKVNRR